MASAFRLWYCGWVKNPWKDRQFTELGPRLQISYLYLRTSPWPLPGVFCLPKKLPIEFISTTEVNQLVDLSVIVRESDVVYVPGCIPGLPDMKVKVNSLCSRLEHIPACEPRRLWIEELRGFYEERRGHFKDPHYHLGQRLFGENPIAAHFKTAEGASEARHSAMSIAGYFKHRFESIHGAPYVISMSNDIKAIVEILQHIDENEIKGRIDAFLVNDWYVSKHLVRLNVFCRNINQFTAAKQEVRDLSGYRKFIDSIA